MRDWILQGWGDKGLWTRNNAEWEIWIGYDSLKITAEGGYGEQEFDLYNKNWEFIINFRVVIGEVQISDVLFFIEDDSKPIIFREGYNVPDNYRTYYIIYDGDIKDSETVPIGEVPPFKIYRVGTVYHFTNLGLSFDYGLIKKTVKLKLVGTTFFDKLYWFGYSAYEDEYELLWYYTEPLDEKKGDAIIF